MAQYRKKAVVIEAITFDELVAHGKAQNVPLIAGMPWSFWYQQQRITHETDDCYLIPTLEGTMKFQRGDMLITGVKGEIYPCKKAIFDACYEPEPALLLDAKGQNIPPLERQPPPTFLLEFSAYETVGFTDPYLRPTMDQPQLFDFGNDSLFSELVAKTPEERLDWLCPHGYDPARLNFLQRMGIRNRLIELANTCSHDQLVTLLDGVPTEALTALRAAIEGNRSQFGDDVASQLTTAIDARLNPA